MYRALRGLAIKAVADGLHTSLLALSLGVKFQLLLRTIHTCQLTVAFDQARNNNNIGFLGIGRAINDNTLEGLACATAVCILWTWSTNTCNTYVQGALGALWQ